MAPSITFDPSSTRAPNEQRSLNQPSQTNGDTSHANGSHLNLHNQPTNSNVDNNVPTSDLVAERDGLLVPETDSSGYRILERPLGTRRHLRVIFMGAGASCLNFLKQATAEALPDITITAYEKNADVGGTWFVNRYAGCACDIPSVNYQFSWKIKLWSRFYSGAREIWDYLKDIEQEEKFVERGLIKLRHRVERAEWDKEEGVWRVRIRNLETDEVREETAEFFVNGGGVLDNWKWPEIEGLHSFKGKLMHTAHYEEGYDLANKRVAVLGAGSSGIQCVSAVQPVVARLYHWIRSPIWITAGFAHDWAGQGGNNFTYSPEQLQYLQDHPEKYLEYRKMIEHDLNQRFKFIIKGSAAANAAREFAYNEMTRKLKGRPDLRDAIIPKTFGTGCRRPTPGNGYLEALTSDNVTVFTEQLSRVTEKGFVDAQGNEHELDVLICATGFDTSWHPRFPFIGADGTDLREQWSEARGGVTPYLSVGIPNFPNHFAFCGPYGPLGHGSFFPLIETWTQYIFQVLRKVQTENIKKVEPKWEAAKEFRQHADLFLKRTAWTSSCRSWFKQGKVDGQAVVWPGSRLHHLEMVKGPRWEDFEIEWWGGNRWAFLGDGFALREWDGSDLTWYLGEMEGWGQKQPEFDKDVYEKMAGWKMQDSGEEGSRSEEKAKGREGHVETNGAASGVHAGR